MSAPNGKLVVISGPSGSGKTSVVRALQKHPRVEFSVSATTRRPRGGEREGIDYHFLSEEEFVRRRDRGAFLEWAEYNGCYYGTLRSAMENALEQGRLFLLEIEVQGTRQLRDTGVPGQYVFLMPPDLEELRRRLEARGADSVDVIEQRLRIAAEEMQAKDLYDHVIVNHDLEQTILEVKAIIGL